MRELVMKVDKFFNITDRNGIKFTVLGGVVECNKLRVGETVEIACPGNVLITGIENIKSYANDLEEAIRGQTVGLSFFGIHHMAFRINEPVVNPYNPETDLVKYLQWDNKANDAEGVLIYRGGNCRK